MEHASGGLTFAVRGQHGAGTKGPCYGIGMPRPNARLDVRRAVSRSAAPSAILSPRSATLRRRPRERFERRCRHLMHSNGPRQTHGFGSRAAAALGVVAALAIAASLVRATLALHEHAERDAAREAELDEWASADIR